MADVNLSTTESLRIAASDATPALVKTTSTNLIEYTISNETIFPSGYDIAQTPGDGVTMRELSLSDNWLGLLTDNPFLVSGMLLPASSLTLSLTIPLGTACLAGRYLQIPATTVTFSPSTTTYVYLKVSRDAAGNVTGALYELNTTGTAPADSLLLGTAVTGVGAITSTVDRRLVGQHGIIALTAGSSWIVPGGLRKVFVQAFGGGGGGGGGSGTGGSSTAGGGGGTTSIGALSCTGGGGGSAGQINTAESSPRAAHGVGSGGTFNRTGGGASGGTGGAGTAGAGNSAGAGGIGGDGGYAADYMTVAPGQSVSFSLGAAGTAGSPGTGGTAGTVGQAGFIWISF